MSEELIENYISIRNIFSIDRALSIRGENL